MSSSGAQIYMHIHLCLLPPIITCTPLLCLEQLQLASDLLKGMAYRRLFTDPASSELLPIVSFACQHSILSSFIQHSPAPYWVLAASFYPNYQLKYCVNLYHMLIITLTYSNINFIKDNYLCVMCYCVVRSLNMFRLL